MDNTVYLQAFDNFYKKAKYDYETGKHHIYKYNFLKCLKKLMHGTYMILADQFVALYVLDDKIFVAVDEKQYELNDHLKIIWSKVEINKRILTIEYNDLTVEKITYTVQELEEGDPTPFIENEDFDYGLFLHNIFESKERQSVLLSNMQLHTRD